MNRACYGINKVLDVKLLARPFKKYANSLTNFFHVFEICSHWVICLAAFLYF